MAHETYESSETEEAPIEFIQASFPVVDLSAYAITGYDEWQRPLAKEKLPVWIGRDQGHKSAPHLWVGVYIDETTDENGMRVERSRHKILLINALRLTTQTGIARILHTGCKEYGWTMEEAKEIVDRCAEAVGLKQVEEEMYQAKVLAAAHEVHNASQARFQLALKAAREAYALPASSDPSTSS